MTDSQHDDDAARLLARERGDDVADPTGSLTRYSRLESLIASLPALPEGVAPTSEWRQRVLAAIDADQVAPGIDKQSSPTEPAVRGRWRRPAVGALAAAAVVVIILFRGRDESPTDPVLAIEIHRSMRPHLTPDTSVGDTLIVRSSASTAGEIRIYDDTGAELARCPAPVAACVVGRDGDRATLSVSLLLRAPGQVRPVFFSAPLESASRGLDGDVAAANQRNITVMPREPIVVR